jgi:hypothetical protein
MVIDLGPATNRRVAVAAILAAMAICRASMAAPNSIAGPILGYLAPAEGLELRAIVGVPGAATLSDRLALSADVVRVRVAPGGSYAFVERKASEPAVVPLTAGAAGQAVPLPGAIASADLVAFSPAGTTELLFSRAAARLQVWTGLPNDPRMIRDVDAHSLPETPLSMAAGDDGSSVLLSSATTVYLLPAGGSARVLLGLGGAAAMAFFPNGDAAIADPVSGAVYRFQAQTGTASQRAVSSTMKGLTAIGTSADGDTTYVANSSARQIASVRLSTGEIQTFQVPAAPQEMTRLGAADTFVISSEAHAPAWLLVGPEKRAVFVPAADRPRPHPRYVPMGSR